MFYVAQESIEGIGFSAVVYAVVGLLIFCLISFWCNRIFHLHWVIGISLASLFLVVYVILIYKLMSKKKE